MCIKLIFSFCQVLGQRNDRDELDSAFQDKLEENEKMADDRTAKKRKKRMKKKEKQKQKKKKGNSKTEGFLLLCIFKYFATVSFMILFIPS